MGTPPQCLSQSADCAAVDQGPCDRLCFGPEAKAIEIEDVEARVAELVGTADGPRQKTLCYLGELNSSAQARWVKTIEVFNEQGEIQQLRLYPSHVEAPADDPQVARVNSGSFLLPTPSFILFTLNIPKPSGRRTTFQVRW